MERERPCQSGWTKGFFEELSRTDDELREAVDDLLWAIRENRYGSQAEEAGEEKPSTD